MGTFLLFQHHSKMSQQIKTKSGLTINPIGSIQDLLSGTSFQEDRVAQGHLQSLGDAFHEIGKTEEGQVMLVAMEGLASQIRTESSFKDAVKVCFRLAKKITVNPWVQFGMFIGFRASCGLDWSVWDFGSFWIWFGRADEESGDVHRQLRLDAHQPRGEAVCGEVHGRRGGLH